MSEYLSQKIRVISFIAILLVFLQHSINFVGYIEPSSKFFWQGNINTVTQYIVGYGLARPAVALFFLLSGYLFFRNFIISKTGEKYKSRLRTLFFPYFFWNSIALLFIMILQKIPFIQTHMRSFYTGYLPGRTILQYLQIIINHGVSFQLWFVFDLMIYALFAPIIYIALRYLSYYILVPFCVIWIFRIPIPSYLAFLDRGGLFYFIGTYFAMRPISISMKTSNIILNYAFIFWLVVMVMKTYIAFIPTRFSLYLSIIDNVSIILGLVSIWFGYDKVKKTTTVISLYTFFIYAAHEPLLELLKYAGITLFGNNQTSQFICFIIVPLLSYMICTRLARLMKKYIPTIYSILTGGR